jgi:hypothetical protein
MVIYQLRMEGSTQINKAHPINENEEHVLVYLCHKISYRDAVHCIRVFSVIES